MKRASVLWFCLVLTLATFAQRFPAVYDTPHSGCFPLSSADICTDDADDRVVQIAAGMLADDVERVTGIVLQEIIINQ